MPNWCNNYIRIYGEEKTIRIITNVIKSINPRDEDEEQVEGKEYEGLFRTLIGVPPEMPKDEYKLNWYDTNIAWFGTKWDVDVSTYCFDFCEDEISFSCETAWSPPIPFLENLCRMYKVNAHIFYSEPGMAFSGETNFTWEDGQVYVNDSEYEYKEGLYLLSNEEFWSEMDSNIEYAVEEDIEVDEFIEEYKAYVSEKDIQDIITMFNQQKKEYDEQQSEVE
jgi:hypothetical protein